ncbi:MAG: hypothetical protein ACXWV4_04425 [Flavitalea sp.]
MNPPIAQDITIRQLEKETDAGNVLVSASLPSITGPFHAIMVNDEKLVLRDDGQGGDEKENDKIFSIVLKEDLSQFQNELITAQQKNERLLGNRPLIKFVNRQGVVVPQQQFKEIKLDSAALRRGIKFPIDFFTLVADPALKDHSLMITDLNVVEDPLRTFNPCTKVGNPTGAWTFGKLVADMANSATTGVTVQDFVRSWLDNWLNNLTINSDPVASRGTIFQTIIVPWIQKSTPGSVPTLGNWKTFNLDMSLAPFKLEAIVNRVDLRGNSGYTMSNAGEGRFVFGVLNTNCNILPFTVIFEYGIPKNSCTGLKDFATQWYNLKGMTVGSSVYNTALQNITEQFTGANTSPSKPNGNSLNQIRTNEIALAGPWELREFRIDAQSHLVKEDPVTKEPAGKFNRLAGATGAQLDLIANYVNTNEAAVLANTNSIDLNFGGQAFLGGKAHTLSSNHIWDGATSAGSGFINNDNARHMLSINTCSGCHGGEGGTSIGNLINDPVGIPHNSFLQISPRGFGTKATLAAFLTGDPGEADGLFKIIDPANRPSGSPAIRGFNDLDRRAQDLEALVTKTCLRKLPGLIEVLRFRPIRMVH